MTQAFRESTIEEICNIEYGTRVVRKKDAGTIYPVYGGGGETFFLDTFNREDRVVVARFAMSEKCTRRVLGRFALNDSGLTLSPKDASVLRQDYLDYFVLSINDQIYESARGTAQKNLDVPSFRQMKVVYPTSLEKQAEIVAKLDSALAEIELLERNLELSDKKANQLLQSVLNSEFTPPIVELDPNNSSVDQNLAIKLLPLGEVFTLEYGKPLDKEFRKIGGSFQAYGANGPISASSKYLIKGPCVIVGRKGSAGEITYVEGNVWPLDVTYYIKHDSEKSDLRYLFYTLRSLNIKQFVRGVKPGLNRNDVYMLPIPLPLIEKQKEIVEKLDTALAAIELYKKRIRKEKDQVGALRQSLLSNAFAIEKAVA